MKSINKKERRNNNKKAMSCVRVMVTLSVVSMVLVLVIVLLNTVFLVERDASHRACGIASASEIVAVGGVAAEPNARFSYLINFSGDRNAIEYRFSWNETTTSAVTAIHLRGPTAAGSWIGPLVGSLCGAPMATACNPQATGSVHLTIQNGVDANGVDVRTVINPYRANPHLYYVEILTTGAPTSPGAARSQLVANCGFQ